MERIGELSLRWLCAGVAALLLAACGGGGGGEGSSEPVGERPAGTALLGTGGGTVQGTDGARVQVPVGALPAEVSITIAKDSAGAPPVPTGFRALGNVFAVTPHGARLAVPATVSVPFDPAALGADRKPALLKVTPGRPWQLIEDVRVEGALVSAQVRGFSYFLPVSVPARGSFIVDPPMPPLPTQSAFSLTLATTGFVNLPVTGSNARLVQQPSADQTATVRAQVTLLPTAEWVGTCWNGEMEALVVRHSAAVYRLPTDTQGGTNRIAIDPETRQVIGSFPVAEAVQNGQYTLDASFDIWNPFPPAVGLAALVGQAADIPANAIIDSVAAHIAIEVACMGVVDGWLGPSRRALWTVDLPVPPVVAARGFDTPPAGVTQQPQAQTVYSGQWVAFEATAQYVGSGRSISANWQRAAPGSNLWVDLPMLPQTDDPPRDALYQFGTTTGTIGRSATGRIWGYADAARDHGTRLRVRFCLPATAALPAFCATSREALLSVSTQFPQPRFTADPRSQTFRVGQTLQLDVSFAGFPLPTRVTWQTRSADDQPWADVDQNVWLNSIRPDNIPDLGFYQSFEDSSDRLLSTRPLTVADRGRQFRATYTTVGGTATSQGATINVTAGVTPPSISAQPQDLSVGNGQTAVFSALADGAGPMSYQWRFNGTPIPGANAPTLALGNVNAGNAGVYELEVSNAEDTVRSRAARLTVATGGAPAPTPLGIVSGPAAQSVQAGGNAAFAVVATGPAPLAYAWERNGQAIPGASGAVLSLTGVAAEQAGDYVAVVSHGGSSVRSLPARLTVQPVQAALQPPAIVAPPAGLTVVQGQRAVLAVGASGAGSLSFQWSRDGSALPGATTPVLVIEAATGADAGNYTVTVGNAAGSVTSPAAGLVVVPPPGAPTITLQPAATLGAVGGVARFAAAATGDPAPLCLWLRNGIVIPGATLCTGYTTDTLTLADNGAVYNLFAYNAGGHVFGGGALLTVTTAVPPVIATQPTAQTWGRGTIVFAVAATGTPAPAIDWAADNERIGTGGRYQLGGCSFDFTATSTALTLSNVAEACIGTTFMAIATNAAGRVESQRAALIAPGVFAARIAGQPGITGSADGPADTALFNTPNYLAPAGDGRVAIGDFGNSTIRLVASNGDVSTLAGSAGVFGFADGTGTAARFNGSGGVAYDSAGNLFVSDWDNHVIRRITPAGEVSTFAGTPGAVGSTDGNGPQARFRNPNGLAIDGADNLYVVDWGNHTLRKITPAGVVSTLAGAAGQVGSADGPGASARFRTPGAVAIDAAGNLYVTDMFNHTVRMVTPGGVVSTIAGQAALSGTVDGTGSAARFDTPAWIAATANGTLFVVSASGDTVRRVSPGGVVDTVVGVAGENTVLRLGTDPRLRNARGVWALGENELLLNADQSLLRVRLP